MFKCLVAVLLIGVVGAEVVKFEKCPNTETKCEVHDVRIAPCAEAAERKPCRIKRGKSAKIEFDFTPAFAATKLQSRAYWMNQLVDLPFVGMNYNGCDVTTCPTTAGERQTFSYQLDIGKKFPLRTYDVKWKLYNENEETELCCFVAKIKLHK